MIGESMVGVMIFLSCIFMKLLLFDECVSMFIFFLVLVVLELLCFLLYLLVWCSCFVFFYIIWLCDSYWGRLGLGRGYGYCVYYDVVVGDVYFEYLVLVLVFNEFLKDSLVYEVIGSGGVYMCFDVLWLRV